MTILKLNNLLDMMYKQSELAEEIGVSVDVIRRAYMPAGMPVHRDETRHVWINGKEFAEWAKKTIANRRKEKKPPLPANKTYCVKCRGAVDFNIKRAKVIASNRWLDFMQDVCPKCGCKTNKPVSKARK